MVSKEPFVNSQAFREKNIARKQFVGYFGDNLPLVTTDAEAVLVEVTLVGLAPLLLGLGATAIATSTTRHLLVGLGHRRPAEARLGLPERLTAGTWPCPRISEAAPVK